MLSELKVLSDTIGRANIQTNKRHQHLRPLPNKPAYRIMLGENGIVGIIQIKDDDREHIFKYETADNSGSWPVVFVNYPWTDKKVVKVFERSKKMGDQLLAFNGMPPAVHDLHKLISSLSFEDVRSFVEKEVGEVPKSGYLLVFDIHSPSDHGFHHPKVFQPVNSILLASNSVSSDRGLDVFGEPMTGKEKSMRTIDLPVVGPTRLWAMNADCPAFYRYGVAGPESFPISSVTYQKMKDALEFVTQNTGSSMFGNTWSAIDVGSKIDPKTKKRVPVYGLLVAYPSEIPPKTELNDIAWGELLSSSPETEFKSLAKPVIDSLRKIQKLNPSATINTFAILPNHRESQRPSKRVALSGTFSVDQMISAIEEWQIGMDNLPKMRGKCSSVLPFQIASESRKEWRRDMSYFSYAESLGLSSAECFDLFLGSKARQKKIAQKGLAIYNRRWKNFALATVPYKTKSGSLSRTHGYHFSEYNKFPTVLGLLLYKAGVTQVNYYESLPFLCGQLVQSYDALHEVYCNVERHGSHPSEYVGSSFTRQICRSSPRKSLDRLQERAMRYMNWINSHRNVEKYKTLSKSKKYLGINPIWLKRMIAELSSRIAEHGLPDRFSEEDRSVFMLGYCAKLGCFNDNADSAQTDAECMQQA